MLFFARFLGEMFSKMRQPAIIGEIIAGILLGPTIFGNLLPEFQGMLFPQTGNVSLVLNGIVQLAVIMLLIVSGLEVNLVLIAKQGKTAVYTSVLGVILPFVLGFIPFYFFSEYFGAQHGDTLIFALFMGTALSISALPVIARTLMDMNLLKSEIGVIIIASAIVNDLFGWIFFSVIIGMITSGGSTNFLTQIGGIFLFLALLYFIGKPLSDRLVPRLQEKFSYPGSILSYIFIAGLVAAAMTEAAGIHAIFGAFMAGVVIGDSSHLKEETREIIHQFVTNIFAPLFFISIGLKVDFFAHFDPFLTMIVLVLGIVGKVAGCGIGARLGGMSMSESIAIGFGMNSRGAMEIILGLLALQAGLINEAVFVALVVLALATSLISAPIMSYFLRKVKKYENLAEIFDPELVIFTGEHGREAVLRELVAKLEQRVAANGESGFSTDKFYKTMAAPVLIPGLALPHAKLPVKRPWLAISISDGGYYYEEESEEPVNITVLLVSPEDKPELHLHLLAEIASVFAEENAVERIKALKDAQLIREFFTEKL
ncbi:MAG: hypothetical protein B6D45_03755 [Ignavibacteriales bacterium UTCHB3]|nr:MAG: hypothetical protein B6D45_03755 [Ignavibacteriales bacterium UTCHB3]